ncbi:MAG: TrmH family RNA methyltransferase [Anaerolineae bacterium]|nr:TrmH family RNA methyltransferase [Anaerolineae bacterium]RIK24060.1 MAG: rRNA methyltransferase [Anaerolineae bacterium]
MDYVFLQCLDDGCRFRFPATTDEAKAICCPRCGGAVAVALPAQGLKPAHHAPPLVGLDLVGCLDNIRSIHNVGSMFRSADGAGVNHLYLAGITATPEHPKLVKAALGANETVPWTYYPNNLDAVTDLRQLGYKLWALERLRQTADMSPDYYFEYPGRLPDKLALVVGNERAGVDPAILERCDAVFGLPMAGQKASLNAAVAFGIAVYSIRFRHMSETGEAGGAGE